MVVEENVLYFIEHNKARFAQMLLLEIFLNKKDFSGLRNKIHILPILIFKINVICIFQNSILYLSLIFQYILSTRDTLRIFQYNYKKKSSEFERESVCMERFGERKGMLKKIL